MPNLNSKFNFAKFKFANLNSIQHEVYRKKGLSSISNLGICIKDIQIIERNYSSDYSFQVRSLSAKIVFAFFSKTGQCKISFIFTLSFLCYAIEEVLTGREGCIA